MLIWNDNNIHDTKQINYNNITIWIVNEVQTLLRKCKFLSLLLINDF